MQQVTLEEAAIHLPELVRDVRGGQEILFMDGRQPVARFVPTGEDASDSAETACLAMAGGAFDWLADEPNIYDDTCGEAIHFVLCPGASGIRLGPSWQHDLKPHL